MKRPEYNTLRRLVKKDDGLMIEEAQNMFRVSLYHDGELRSVVVVMKSDDFTRSKDRVSKILDLSRRIKSGTNL